MRKWSERTEEVRNLMNPAFCGRILFSAVAEYKRKTKHALPFPLVFLILPLVLPRRIREKVNSKTKLINWTQKNQELIYNFDQIARDLVEITKEALEFMLQTGYLKITDSGEIDYNHVAEKISKTKYTDIEVKNCLLTAESVARWFSSTNKVEMIYFCFGVRP